MNKDNFVGLLGEFEDFVEKLDTNPEKIERLRQEVSIILEGAGAQLQEIIMREKKKNDEREIRRKIAASVMGMGNHLLKKSEK